MVLLSTSDASKNSQCYLTTTNIDGETDIKTKTALALTAQKSLVIGLSFIWSVPSILNEQPVIYCEAENALTSSFDGTFQLTTEGSIERLSITSILLRGCRLVFTGIHRCEYPFIDWIVGCAISVGGRTKIEYSTKTKPPKKESETLTLLNHMIIYLLYLLIFICIVHSTHFHHYLG